MPHKRSTASTSRSASKSSTSTTQDGKIKKQLALKEKELYAEQEKNAQLLREIAAAKGVSYCLLVVWVMGGMGKSVWQILSTRTRRLSVLFSADSSADETIEISFVIS
ncbi:hypothetical protein BT69DRAFT_63289 [Atractiella rhizophila]|nr:hypothetical protein BT69DRAFT_63289 [Atractiella rhizophila]